MGEGKLEVSGDENVFRKAVLTSIGDGVIVVDVEGRTQMINMATQRMLDWKAEDVEGKSYQDIWYIKDNLGNKVISKHPFDVALAGGAMSTGDYYLTKKSGVSFPAHITTAPVKLNDKVIGAVMTFYDISLEKMIDRAKTEFVSLASHQLRTPLSAVNWYVEMLLSGDWGKVDSNQRQYLEEIYDSNKRMVDLVNALLNVSRIDLGTFAIQPEDINIIDLAKKIVTELRPQIVIKKLQVSESYDPDLPVIRADPNLAQIVIENLMVNAVKYTPAGGKASLEVKLAIKGGGIGDRVVDKDSVLIKVADTGYGIPQDAKEKIFEKLFRADNVREKGTEGAGLGLYIVKAIVDAVGGEIWFDSAENQGSTFYVLLPLSGMPKRKGTKQLSHGIFGRVLSSR